MVPPPQISPQRPHSPTTNSPDFAQIASKALQTGLVTGTIGAFGGASYGIFRASTPVIFAISSSIKWFIFGSTYMGSKSLIWHTWGGEENLNPSDFIKAGGAAGGVTGIVAGILRGRSFILPGMVVFGTLGAGSSFFAQKLKINEPKTSTSWLDSKWSPMKRLTDKEYEEKLAEKLLRLDAEIAIIDENIESLKASRQDSSSPDDKAKREGRTS
ncbi:hypothetical protein F4810DRAFT_20878 [Camillea tinctor]|nr:hypothetical protein F4810DRAFT_20878 [Camillea tinctor]